MRKLIFFLSLLFFFLVFLAVKDNYLIPWLAHKRLGTKGYASQIKEDNPGYERNEDKVVWNSKVLDVRPPLVPEKSLLAQKVLAADPNNWIDINLSTQTLCIFHSGGTNCFAVSTGMPWTPTPTGTYYVWIKLPSTTMSGPGYYLPGVLWTMYFYRGYGIHGCYWHNNFGQPMSHGCVNMRNHEAQFVYERSSVGTRVVVHY